MAFRDRIKEARINNNLTQQELAFLIGVAKTTVTGYEKGNREPNMATVAKIMDVLGVEANFLWQDEMAEAANKDKAILNVDEYPLMTKYRRLNDSGKEYVDSQVDYALSQERYQLKEKRSPHTPDMKNIQTDAEAFVEQLKKQSPPTKN